MKKLLLFVAFIFILFSCKKETDSLVSDGHITRVAELQYLKDGNIWLHAKGYAFAQDSIKVFQFRDGDTLSEERQSADYANGEITLAYISEFGPHALKNFHFNDTFIIHLGSYRTDTFRAVRSAEDSITLFYNDTKQTIDTFSKTTPRFTIEL